MWSFLIVLIIYVIGNSNAEKETIHVTEKDGWKLWKKNTDNTVGWRIQNLPPNGDFVYGICEIQQTTNTKSWLRSPFIPRQNGHILFVNVSFTMRNCPDPSYNKISKCNETFLLLNYESDDETDDIEYNYRYFKLVKSVKPYKKWIDKVETSDVLNHYTFRVPVSRKGVILAFPNVGSCIMLKKVVVYYNYCPEIKRNLVYLKKTPNEINSGTSINAECVSNSKRSMDSQEKQIRYLRGLCKDNGIWAFYDNGIKIYDIPKKICQCLPGHQPNSKLTACQDCESPFYKKHFGNHECKKCPKNSESNMGSKNCSCTKGYYNVKPIRYEIDCRSPPAKPTHIISQINDQARIKLTWNHSTDQIISRHLNEEFYYNITCVNCPNQVIFHPSSKIYGNSVTILGTLPSKEYSIKLTSVSIVSQFVKSAFDIGQSSSVTRILTNSLKDKPKLTIYEMKIEGSWLKLKWKLNDKENAAKTRILKYEVMLMGFYKQPSSYQQRFPNYQKINFTDNQENKFNIEHLKSIKIFIAKVRAMVSTGWAKYSETKQIINNQISTNNPSIDPQINKKVKTPYRKTTPSRINHIISTTTSSESLNYIKDSTESTNSSDSTNNNDIILLIVGSILLMIMLIIIGAVLLFCLKRQIIFPGYRHKNKKMKYFETPMNNQVVDSSAYTLPRYTSNKYQDPGTYDDISIAIQDFTKELKPEWIYTENVIHLGKFADVYKGYLQLPNETQKRLVGIKIVKENIPEKEYNDYLLEASTVGQFQHENIMKLEGCINENYSCILVMEYMENGDLLTYLKNNSENLNLLTQLKMLRDIANGMRYLGSINFIHRDLAARNIMVSDTLVCKIGDFGLSRKLSNNEDVYSIKSDTQRISVRWSAPEVILERSFSLASDIWSYGVVAWEVLSGGERPYWQWADEEVLDAVRSCYRLPPPPDCPIALHTLLLQCWAQNPDQRISFGRLLIELNRMMGVAMCNNNNPPATNLNNSLFTSETAHLLLNCADHLQQQQQKPQNYQYPTNNNYPFYTPPPLLTNQSLYSTKHQNMIGSPPLPPLPIHDSPHLSKTMASIKSHSSKSCTPHKTPKQKVQPDFNTISAARLSHNNILQNNMQSNPNNIPFPTITMNNKLDYQQYPFSTATTANIDLIPSSLPITHNNNSNSSNGAANIVHLVYSSNNCNNNNITNDHQINSSSSMHHQTIEQLLAKINLDHKYTSLFIRHGLRYTHQIQSFNSDQLKMIGIKSKLDRKSIICSLQYPLYC